MLKCMYINVDTQLVREMMMIRSLFGMYNIVYVYMHS